MNENELIHWESEYSVGVEKIDNQHKELMNLINDLISRSVEQAPMGNRGENKKHFLKISALTRDYTLKHFRTEEKILSNTTYGKFEDHKREHEKLTAKMAAIIDELKNTKGEIDLYNLTVNFKEWLLSHILLFDKEAKEYFRTENLRKPID